MPHDPTNATAAEHDEYTRRLLASIAGNHEPLKAKESNAVLGNADDSNARATLGQRYVTEPLPSAAGPSFKNAADHMNNETSNAANQSPDVGIRSSPDIGPQTPMQPADLLFSNAAERRNETLESKKEGFRTALLEYQGGPRPPAQPVDLLFDNAADRKKQFLAEGDKIFSMTMLEQRVSPPPPVRPADLLFGNATDYTIPQRGTNQSSALALLGQAAGREAVSDDEQSSDAQQAASDEEDDNEA